jgi:hypothetical protein
LPKLEDPWAALSAYRLAHLSLRTAKTKGALKTAHSCFVQAASGNLLGPLPAIYRLSVLHRLKSQFPNDSMENSIPEAFDEAVRSFRDCHNSASLGWQGSPWKKAQIQDGVFNMIELASYFLGIPYGFEGLGLEHPDWDLRAFFPTERNRHWILVGHDHGLRTVRYSRDMALAELDVIASKFPDSIGFKLSAEESSIRKGCSSWEHEAVNGLKLLAVLLYGEISGLNDLHWKVMSIPQGNDSSAFRQVKLRMKKSLKRLSGLPQESIFLEERSTSLPVINPHLCIYGAVQCSMLRI